jgi:hypothetical protein
MLALALERTTKLIARLGKPRIGWIVCKEGIEGA